MSPDFHNVLEVENLNLSFRGQETDRKILKNLNFVIPPDTVVGMAGSSGAGKSITALSIMQMFRKNINFDITGKFKFGNPQIRLDLLNEKELNNIRGNRISMILQDAGSALNPVIRCGHQLEEVILTHYPIKAKKVRELVFGLMEKVRLQDIERIYDAFPHEISGGQAQRLMIAMGIANHPNLIIADEPTTGLDYSLKAEIMDMLKELQKSEACSVLLISHEMDIIKKYASLCMVISEGEIIEQGPTQKIFTQPENTFTNKLVLAQKELENPIISQFSNNEEKILEVRKLSVKYPVKEVAFFSGIKHINAVEDVNFTLIRGINLGIMGPSGCGKSTIAKCISGLINHYEGEVVFTALTSSKDDFPERRRLAFCRQLIFQDPYSALHPKIKVLDLVSEPLLVHKITSSEDSAKKSAVQLLTALGIDAKLHNSYPSELSGGERQRVCIARALTLKPQILILDEAVSKLDGIHTLEILDLLKNLQAEYGLSYVVISHDERIIKYICQDILILDKGSVVFYGSVSDYFK